ncbi:MAG: glycine oxidase ThiO [Alphaproteobacteria bacterium]|nr:glycine oxidase ThiO [Alphaproteobacteria bacterium]MCB9930108.1 glycine oxidase ThiO [Alphaproteobacteria bacterium]
MASKSKSVLIIGGGINGLAIAWRLAEAGCTVDVLDAGAIGPGTKGATWAAGGMLAASVEAEPGEEALTALCLDSQQRWPAFRDALEAASGVSVGYRDEGTLVVATNRDEAAALRHHYDYQTGLGLALEWLTPAEARRREPHLGRTITAGVYSPGDHQVENRDVLRALVVAAERAGVRLHPHTPVEALETVGDRATGVRIAGEVHAADAVVLAAGAWCGAIRNIPPEAKPPVRPLKGQMLAVQMDPAAPILSHVVWAPATYLIPRLDGRLLIGATVEERGFDDTVTAGGLLTLLDTAWRALPTIEELPVVETWAGFRPTSRDDAPIFGPTAVEGLFLATGHHRNGILLAPMTADAVGAAVLGHDMPAVARPFTNDRFASRPTTKAVA